MLNIPDDLSGVGDEELDSLLDQIKAAAEAIGPDADTDEAVDELLKLADAHDRLTAEKTQRQEAAEANRERVNDALNRIGLAPSNDSTETNEDEQPAEQQPEDEQPTEDEQHAEAEADKVAEPVAASTTKAATAADESAEQPFPRTAPSEDEVSTPNTTAPVPPADEQGTPPTEADEANQSTADNGDSTSDTKTQEATVQNDGPSSTPAVHDPVAALSAARPAAAAPVDTETPSVVPFQDAGAIYANSKGDNIGTRELAGLVMEQHRRFQRTGGDQTVILATARRDFDEDLMLSPDSHERNFEVMERATDKAESLVASGANCALLTPDYDIFNVARPMSPIEDALPVVGAPRGGIRYVQPPVWSATAGGVRVTTGAQDAAGYTTQSPAGPTAPKPCVRLTCPPPVECTVDAISSCVTIGNLQYNTFPELIRVFLDHLAVAQAQTKEIYYLDAIEAGSTEVNFAQAYSATRSLVWAFNLAAVGLRKRLHMPLNAPLQVLVPDVLIPILRTDMVNDQSMGMGFVNANAEQVARELFNSFNLDVTFYYDYSTGFGSNGSMQVPQGAGALNAFPVTMRSYMFPVGTWVRLDGGTLDLGVVRDSSLNRVNDLQIFSEEWTQVCKRGGESLTLDIDVCPNGSAPNGVTAIACAS